MATSQATNARYTQRFQQQQYNAIAPTDIQPEISTHFSAPQAPSYDSVQTVLARKRHGRNFFSLAIAGCLLLLFAVAVYNVVRMANTTEAASTPSGNAFIPTASSILKDAQTSSAIDNTLTATQTTKTFMANQRVYVTFTITSGKQDGSIEAKWYADGQVVMVTILPHQHENTHGVFSNVYISATPDGAVELYWCTQPNCSDAKLAQVVHFVVTPINTAYLRISYYKADTLLIAYRK